MNHFRTNGFRKDLERFHRLLTGHAKRIDTTVQEYKQKMVEIAKTPAPEGGVLTKIDRQQEAHRLAHIHECRRKEVETVIDLFNEVFGDYLNNDNNREKHDKAVGE